MIKAIEDRAPEPYTFGVDCERAWNEGPDFLDAFSMALCVVNRDLRVVATNVAAQAILGKTEWGLKNLVNDSTERNSAALRKQIADAVCSGGRTCLMLRTPYTEPLIWTVRPLGRDRGPFSLVSILPLTSSATAVIPYLRDIYKLSKAEAEIAAATASGMEIVEIANIRGVSVNTLRAQIVSIKAKMGLSRMLQVATIVCRIHATIAWL